MVFTFNLLVCCRHDVMEALNQQQRVLLALEKSVRDLKDDLQHSTHTGRSDGRGRARWASAPTTYVPLSS